MDNMVRLVARINEIQDEIWDLEAEKQPLFDEMTELREVMIRECIHPVNHLIEHEDHVYCKFCERRIAPANE
jgi:hypothetical protein